MSARRDDPRSCYRVRLAVPGGLGVPASPAPIVVALDPETAGRVAVEALSLRAWVGWPNEGDDPRVVSVELLHPVAYHLRGGRSV